MRPLAALPPTMEIATFVPAPGSALVATTYSKRPLLLSSVTPLPVPLLLP